MAPLGYAVMKYESNTKTAAPNALRYVTWRARRCENSRGNDVAKISSRLKVERCCIVSCLVGGRVHIVYLSSVSVHIIFTYLSAQKMLLDTNIKVLEKPTLLEKSPSCGCSTGKVASRGKNDSSTP